MWSRVVEVMLGLWLAISHFIFQDSQSVPWLWGNNLTCAALIISLALLSYWRPLRHAHLGLLAVAGWLIGVGFLAAPHPTPPALQNQIVLGLLLLMFGVIPNHADDAPESWQEFNRRMRDN